LADFAFVVSMSSTVLRTVSFVALLCLFTTLLRASAGTPRTSKNGTANIRTRRLRE
jgi:hypothetical protein